VSTVRLWAEVGHIKPSQWGRMNLSEPAWPSRKPAACSPTTPNPNGAYQVTGQGHLRLPAPLVRARRRGPCPPS